MRRSDTPGDRADRELRRVRMYLAVPTVALLCVLILVLGLSVYVTMQNSLLQPARQAVERRAATETDQLRELERGKEASDGGESRGEQEPGGVFITFADSNLRVLGGVVTPFGRSLSDPAAGREVLSSKSPMFTTRTTGGQDYLIYSKPVLAGGRVLGVVQTGISKQQYEANLQSLTVVLVTVGGLGVIAVVGITAVVVRRALRPIRTSMRRQRDFVADAAHELRTPLTIMCTAAELGLASENLQNQQVALEQTLAQGKQLTHLVEDLSLLALADSGALTLEHTSIDLTELTGEIVEDLSMLAEDRGVELVLYRAADVRVLGDDRRLRQLIVILLDNALKHAPDDGRVKVTVNRHGEHARIEVHDSGPGIASKDLPHVFDRFYRADRSASQGSGLGLAIGRWIAEAHEGSVSAANALDGGAVFTVTLPLAPGSPASKQSSHVA